MRPDRFTIKSQEAIEAAQRLAEARRNPQVTPAHLLVALLDQDGGIVTPVLHKLGVDAGAVARTVVRDVDDLPTLEGSPARSRLRPASWWRCCARPRTRRAISPTSTSASSTCCWR